jgi:hypothetical protein
MTANIFVRTKSPENAEVYFISPVDGETVTNLVVVKFGLKNMRAVPVWINEENTGHHHLIIDAELPDLNLPIPDDDQNIHYEQGETETELTLPPGQHTLQLLLADSSHIPHDPPVYSERISITVE